MLVKDKAEHLQALHHPNEVFLSFFSGCFNETVQLNLAGRLFEDTDPYAFLMLLVW